MYSNGATVQRSLSDGRVVSGRGSSLRAPSVTPSRKSSKSSLRRTLTPNGLEVCDLAEMRFSEDTRRPMMDGGGEPLDDVEEERGRPVEREKFVLSATLPDLGGSMDFMDNISFSNRGSVLLGGKRALEGQKQRQSIIQRESERNPSRESSMSRRSVHSKPEESLAAISETTAPLQNKRSFRDEDGGQLMRTITERSLPESTTESCNIQDSASARQSMQLLASQVAEDFKIRSASGESQDDQDLTPIDSALIEQIKRKAELTPTTAQPAADHSPLPPVEAKPPSTDRSEDRHQPQETPDTFSPSHQATTSEQAQQVTTANVTSELETQQIDSTMGANSSSESKRLQNGSRPPSMASAIELDNLDGGSDRQAPRPRTPKSKPASRPATATSNAPARPVTPEILDSQQLSELANAPSSPEPITVDEATLLKSPDPIVKKQLQARPDIAQRYAKSISKSVKEEKSFPKLEMRILSKEIEEESQRIRALYEQDTIEEMDWRQGEMEPSAFSAQGSSNRNSALDPLSAAESEDAFDSSVNSQLRPRPLTAAPSIKRESVLRREGELAGGIEDWTDISATSVDRYGFIVDAPISSRPGSPNPSNASEPRPPQRISTALQAAYEAPRKQGLFRRTSVSNREPSGNMRAVSSSRSLRTTATTRSTKSAGADNETSTISTSRTPGKTRRAIINRLPGMSERRLMDEAGDMLTLPPGLGPQRSASVSASVASERKVREGRRTEKWRQMAKVIPRSEEEAARGIEGAGGGMQFHFNARDPKLIRRVWKGIPDVWRGAAWSSFLLTSSMLYQGSPSTSDLVAAYRSLVNVSSADDNQIDMDMPRTVNNHIMFRTRYRGGQRLLFRVLHVLSLYFPETGYVQGMAAIVSTLLNYFDEEMCFVNAARMWELRGLKKLFAPGFDGLMSALDDFQSGWLKRGSPDISDRLDELGIYPMTYGTRWYLTLFNYSVPFEVQLRIWDLFILLGDPDPNQMPSLMPSHSGIPRSLTVGSLGKYPSDAKDKGWHGQLDILHAAGCTLIDASREMLVGPQGAEGEERGADFENSMKVLTSFVPVRDEELFVKVMGVEWRRGGRK